MDTSIIVAPGVWRLTVNLDDEDVPLFEGLWSVPNGVALHCYLIRGDKSVLVDPWAAGGYGREEIEVDLDALGLGWKDIDQTLSTAAVVKGARYDLGRGIVLEERGGFWFVEPAGVALTGDVFSGLGWVDETVWTEDQGEHEARYFEDEALRWFSGRPLVPAALPSGVKIIAPAHGCLWKNPESAVARAQKFADWGRGPGLDEVTVVWPSGAEFDAGADALVGGVLDVGVGLNLFRVPGDEPLALAAGARRASLVVVAAGLDDGFLAGLEKDLWRPSPHQAASELRSEMKDRL